MYFDTVIDIGIAIRLAQVLMFHMTKWATKKTGHTWIKEVKWSLTTLFRALWIISYGQANQNMVPWPNFPPKNSSPKAWLIPIDTDEDLGIVSLLMLILQNVACTYWYWYWHDKVKLANIVIDVDIAKCSQQILILALILQARGSNYRYWYWVQNFTIAQPWLVHYLAI